MRTAGCSPFGNQPKIIITNWYRRNRYSGRILNFLSFDPISNKISIIKNLVDRATGLSHDSFHSKNLNIIRKILFFLNHYPPALIEKNIKIRLEQNQNKQNNSLLTDTQKEARDYSSNNTFVLPYFGQISKTIQSMLKKFKIHTTFRIPFKMDSIITLGKDSLNKFEKGGVVYKLICKVCNST